ncbi:CACTA en-spm transposon protein [Cucumis melo var. makuwa]|uniref:CACTA en-spm transposon protein n=1 Tax=Cucumis melo var. makuwa TaxID=1194695 RepID=A0A5A7UFB0_CUCMM|nr:CACTA en-spm transposon protein [Cucumis melo var. makuwa]
MQEQSWTNKAARQKQPYNHNSGSKSFLQRQHELAEQRDESVDRMGLFKQTYVRDGTFLSQATEDAHVKLYELKQAIEALRKISEMLASQVEQMLKLIEEMSQAQRGPTMIPCGPVDAKWHTLLVRRRT